MPNTEATRLSKALEVLFILHADHEQNCSTATMRGVGSSCVDPYCALAAAVAAVFGPLHGGANEAVLHMLRRIGAVSAVPEFLDRVKRSETRLMGFGHRIYKNYDPRARIIRRGAHEVLAATAPARCWRSPSSWSASPCRRTTSSRGGSTRRSISTAA
jgi:citrate synthase